MEEWKPKLKNGQMEWNGWNAWKNNGREGRMKEEMKETKNGSNMEILNGMKNGRKGLNRGSIRKKVPMHQVRQQEDHLRF